MMGKSRPNTPIPNGVWRQKVGEAALIVGALQSKVLTWEQLNVVFRCLDDYKRIWGSGEDVAGTGLEVVPLWSSDVVAYGYLHKVSGNTVEALKH